MPLAYQAIIMTAKMMKTIRIRRRRRPALTPHALPHFGQPVAEDEISFPHSLHLVIMAFSFTLLFADWRTPARQ
jgi:hypothetical protein